MRNRIFIIIFLFSVRCFASNAEVHLPFEVGETLEYRIHWGLMNVGTSRMSTEWVEHDGRRLIAIRLRNWTNDVLSKLYPVDDFIETLVDPVTFLPVRYTKKLKQGKYQCDEVTHFDYESGLATWVSNKDQSEKQYGIDTQTRDILTFLYYTRLTEFVPESIEQRQLMADEKIYNLEIQSEKLETVDLDEYGKIECLKLEPKASFQGIFVRKGRMWMWISRDPRRICTEIKSKVFVGKVSLTLSVVTGPGNDFWVVPKDEKAENSPKKPIVFRRR